MGRKWWDWPQRTPDDKPRGIQSLEEMQLSEEDARIIADATASPARVADAPGCVARLPLGSVVSDDGRTEKSFDKSCPVSRADFDRQGRVLLSTLTAPPVRR